MGMTYDELTLGTELTGSLTVGEPHFSLSAGLFNDFNPMHVDAEFAARSSFGQRILHGPTIIGIMMGVLGNAVAGTGIAEVDLRVRMTAPVVLGDTLRTHWVVAARDDKPRWQGGLVTFDGSCRTQAGEVTTATTKIIVSNSIRS